ncbi:MAG TPA: hypothetical protein DDX84_13320 [Nitrospiraceae bacterium]|nr:hypothetical protein [Nitrospiraceae bacterium]
MIFILTFAFALVVLLFLPDNVLAWGPATHMQLGWNILNNLSMIIGPVRSLIEAYPYDYLYGCISADIVVGKRFARALNHCHNWNVGFKVLEKADSQSQKAFAYGYLSHLAADTIAHNYFVPEKMVTAYSTRLLRHFYWEMRFDAMADRMVWNLPYKIMEQVHQDNDPLLERVIWDTLLSFKTNKTIFNNVLLLHRMEQWHKMINKLSSYSRWGLHEEDVTIYYQRSFNAVIDIMNNHQNAGCLIEDPAGRKNLAMAKRLRRRMKLRKMVGMPVNMPVFPFKEVSHPAEEIWTNRA